MTTENKCVTRKKIQMYSKKLETRIEPKVTVSRSGTFEIRVIQTEIEN